MTNAADFAAASNPTPRDLAYQSEMAAINEVFVAKLIRELRMVARRRRQG